MRRVFLGLAILLLGARGVWAAPAAVTVEKAWVRYLLPSVPAAGYMVVMNDGDSDAVITGAASPACGMLMLHKTEDSSGMSMMVAMGAVTVPAHGRVVFAPGGYHLMCVRPVMKVGETVQVKLSFADGKSIFVEAPVYGAQGSP